MFTRIVVFLVVPFVLLCLAIAGYYTYYDRYAYRLVHESRIHYERANAMKHAYAALQMFQLIQSVVRDADTAECAVILLGRGNEYLEQAIRFSQRDSTLEIVKDMHNNQVGVTTARWLMQAHDTSGSIDAKAAILALAKHKALIDSPEQLATLKVDVADKPHDVAFASAWFTQQRDTIISKTQKALAKK